MLKEKIINSDRFCNKCGEFLGMTCDPFGRTSCSKECFAEPKIVCPECMDETPQEELDCFGGLCEECSGAFDD